jgi:hypothetical protein
MYFGEMAAKVRPFCIHSSRVTTGRGFQLLTGVVAAAICSFHIFFTRNGFLRRQELDPVSNMNRRNQRIEFCH